MPMEIQNTLRVHISITLRKTICKGRSINIDSVYQQENGGLQFLLRVLVTRFPNSPL